MSNRNNHSCTALLIVDIQNDFIPGGALGVPEGDQIIPLINQLLLNHPFDVKIATKDWHPPHHKSFAKEHGKKPGDVVLLGGIEQILWPVHCVQETFGAEFAPGLHTDTIEQLFHKGTDSDIDSYSAFFDNEHRRSTGLLDYLKKRKVSDLFIAGLATDYCVKYSALDAVQLGFNTYVIKDACRAVNLRPDDEIKAFEAMSQAGVHLIKSKEIYSFK